MRQMWQSFTNKHGSYYNGLLHVSLFFGYIYAIFRLLISIWNSIQGGDFWSFVISIIFSTVIMAATGILFGAIFFLILAVITTIPYLMIRGFIK